ncbi:unnamed protein product [Ostreobium quekettii]|uniref:E2 ubiquitin-conjugating enzyme n=1 Tax=Ostreobium quekettii TaxID=121088 RepID=A0A8S1J1Q8_9CHLO|nr:unnamed protein product [Ostreobium quekettii]|eukprot:evm.model.scf_217.9 EVM.evm.TU.scf_217.9   scf_217:85744-90202(-)
MLQGALGGRMARELVILERQPPPGVRAWPKGEASLQELEAQIEGPRGSDYEGGVFKLTVRVPDRYPFEPPEVRFVTPIYHPNIDTGGRICLDILNMPPKGGWRPSLNISTVLMSIGVLMTDPNPDDGLMADVAEEYKHRREVFRQKARQLMRRHALPQHVQPGPGSSPANPTKPADCTPPHVSPDKMTTLNDAAASNAGQGCTSDSSSDDSRSVGGCNWKMREDRGRVRLGRRSVREWDAQEGAAAGGDSASAGTTSEEHSKGGKGDGDSLSPVGKSSRQKILVEGEVGGDGWTQVEGREEGSAWRPLWDGEVLTIPESDDEADDLEGVLVVPSARKRQKNC